MEELDEYRDMLPLPDESEAELLIPVRYVEVGDGKLDVLPMAQARGFLNSLSRPRGSHATEAETSSVPDRITLTTKSLSRSPNVRSSLGPTSVESVQPAIC